MQIRAGEVVGRQTENQGGQFIRFLFLTAERDFICKPLKSFSDKTVVQGLCWNMNTDWLLTVIWLLTERCSCVVNTEKQYLKIGHDRFLSQSYRSTDSFRSYRTACRRSDWTILTSFLLSFCSFNDAFSTAEAINRRWRSTNETGRCEWLILRYCDVYHIPRKRTKRLQSGWHLKRTQDCSLIQLLNNGLICSL